MECEHIFFLTLSSLKYTHLFHQCCSAWTSLVSLIIHHQWSTLAEDHVVTFFENTCRVNLKDNRCQRKSPKTMPSNPDKNCCCCDQAYLSFIELNNPKSAGSQCGTPTFWFLFIKPSYNWLNIIIFNNLTFYIGFHLKFHLPLVSIWVRSLFL